MRPANKTQATKSSARVAAHRILLLLRNSYRNRCWSSFRTDSLLSKQSKQGTSGSSAIQRGWRCFVCVSQIKVIEHANSVPVASCRSLSHATVLSVREEHWLVVGCFAFILQVGIILLTGCLSFLLGWRVFELWYINF